MTKPFVMPSCCEMVGVSFKDLQVLSVVPDGAFASVGLRCG